jgi:hypothetical protein
VIGERGQLILRKEWAAQMQQARVFGEFGQQIRPRPEMDVE